MVTVGEANARHMCLNCGSPGAQLLRHKDGRYLRACALCLRSDLLADWSMNSVTRDPLPEEGGPPMNEPDYAEDGLCWYGRFAPESMRRCGKPARWHWPDAPTSFGRACRWCDEHQKCNDTEIAPPRATGEGGRG